MTLRGKIGKRLIEAIISAEFLYELAAFADGRTGLPTESQLIKQYERAHGVIARIAVGSALVGAAVVLFTHLVYPTF